MEEQGVMKSVTFILISIFCLNISGVFSFDLTILHTNDVHSRINETNTYGGRCTDTEGKCYGGIARQKTLIDRLRKEYPNTLLMDAGDQFQGTLWFYKYGGELLSWAMNQLGYDALGNHEFDKNIDGLIPFLRNASFPVVSSNIDDSKEHKLQQGMYKPYHVFTVGGEKIGVIGYTTTDTPMISSPGSLIFTDEVAAIRKNVKILQSQNINKIIALGHSGFKVDKRIAEEVEGIDIVVGGHTNTFLYTGSAPSNEKPVGVYPTVVTQNNGAKVLVVQDYTFGKYLGFLQVTFDNQGVITNYSGNPILLDWNIEQDEYLKNITKEFEVLLLEELNLVIGKTLVHLEGDRSFCRVKECNMGNLIADGLVHQNLKHADSINYTHVFISLVNGGSIRSTFERGNIIIPRIEIDFGVITGADVQEVQPFSNGIEIIKLQGKYLRQALEHSVTDYDPADPHGRFFQVSGLRIVYDLSKNVGSRVVSVHVKCADCKVPELVPLEDNKIYYLALSAFVLNGGDGYTMIRDHAIQDHPIGDLDAEVLLEYRKEFNKVTVI
ncbi:hypothetical protein KUTeg_007005 [Tegillarca granosa]|uniref:5'-nucleotidase n=1 Tax=Tegillarca granosa TaxID=220873 RepID=A0ABQ9FBZ1_TEGGR|nr:hypothetical protein KUTeg_007005 [Tegillarca granosa]